MDVGIKCPHCDSERLNKSGWRYSSGELKQSYYCRDCHRITVNPKPIDKKEAEATFSEGITSAEQETGSA